MRPRLSEGGVALNSMKHQSLPLDFSEKMWKVGRTPGFLPFSS